MNQSGWARLTFMMLAVPFLTMAHAPPASRAATVRADGPPVRDAVVRAWRDHVDAAIRKDLEAVLDIYADDIVYVVEGSPEIRGREAMASLEAHTLADFDVLSAEHTTDALQAFEEVAYELGTVIGPIRPKDGEPRTVTFHFMAMWRRQADGGWRIAHLVGRPEESTGSRDREIPHRNQDGIGD